MANETKTIKLVPLKELRQEMGDYISRIQKGESFLVLKRSRPVFKIVPPRERDELWEEVIDFTRVQKGGVRLEELLKRL